MTVGCRQCCVWYRDKWHPGTLIQAALLCLPRGDYGRTGQAGAARRQTVAQDAAAASRGPARCAGTFWARFPLGSHWAFWTLRLGGREMIGARQVFCDRRVVSPSQQAATKRMRICEPELTSSDNTVQTTPTHSRATKH